MKPDRIMHYIWLIIANMEADSIMHHAAAGFCLSGHTIHQHSGGEINNQVKNMENFFLFQNLCIWTNVHTCQKEDNGDIMQNLSLNHKSTKLTSIVVSP